MEKSVGHTQATIPSVSEECDYGVIYHDPTSVDLTNNNKEGYPPEISSSTINDSEYIVVTLDEDQSIDTVLSNLNEQYQLNPQNGLVLLSLDETYPSQESEPGYDPRLRMGTGEMAKDDPALLVDDRLTPDVIWDQRGGGSFRVLTDDEGVESGENSSNQIIYVSSDDVVTTEPTEQFIVLDPNSSKVIDDESELASASPVQYAVFLRDQDSALAEEPSSPQLCFVPPPPASSQFEEEEEAEEKRREPVMTPAQKRKKPKQLDGAARKRVRPLKKKPPPSSILPVQPSSPEQTRDVQCTLCKAYTFDLKSHLKLHCNVCNVAFKDLDSLNEHKKIHVVTASSHCSCGICGMKFASSEQLRGHLQINKYHRNLMPTTTSSKRTSLSVAASFSVAATNVTASLSSSSSSVSASPAGS